MKSWVIFGIGGLLFSNLAFAAEEPVEKQLDEIQKTLTVIQAQVASLSEGQQKLSEEHQQLRYWIHRK